MIRIFRRHRFSCPQTSETYRKCSCPLYAEGKVGDEILKKTALNLTSWEAAQKKVREWEAAGTLKTTAPVSLKFATARYLAELEARHISAASRRKFELLFDLLATFMVSQGLTNIRQLDVPEIRDFRATWTWGPMTHAKYLERIRSFLRFCQQNKWISDNPAALLKPPKVEPTEVVPFTDEDLAKIYSATTRPRMIAFLLILQYTGLRISDAVKLHQDRIQDGKLSLRTQKTKADVWLPLPPFLLSALESIHTKGGYYFWTGEGKLSTAVGNWRADLSDLFKKIKIDGYAHKFRHTFITRLLSSGTPVDRVARIVGNSPRIIEKHYRHYIAEMQEQLEKDVSRTWGTSKKLIRVK
jgi:integrase